MNRRITITLASAVLMAFISTPAAPAGAQTAQQDAPPTAIERTGRKSAKEVVTTCPIHPDVVAKAGKCPKCRMEERKQKHAREKKEKKDKENNGQGQADAGTTQQ